MHGLNRKCIRRMVYETRNSKDWQQSKDQKKFWQDLKRISWGNQKFLEISGVSSHCRDLKLLYESLILAQDERWRRA